MVASSNASREAANKLKLLLDTIATQKYAMLSHMIWYTEL